MIIRSKTQLPLLVKVHGRVVNGSFVFLWSMKFLFKVKAKLVKMKNKQEKEVMQKKEQQLAFPETQQTTSKPEKILEDFKETCIILCFSQMGNLNTERLN